MMISKLWRRFWFVGMRPEARFAGWVARLTLVLCFIGAIQAWSFVQSERAFVAMEAITIIGGVQAGSPLRTSTSFKNSGKSPAVEVVVYFNSGVKLPSPPTYGQSRRAIPPIVSGGHANMNWGTGAPLQEAEAEALKTGKIEFYVWGYVSFKDEFSIFGPREVGYCAVLDRKDGSATAFQSCPSSEFDYAR
jgi:hypothetical protein